jgi:hypothetical protein
MAVFIDTSEAGATLARAGFRQDGAPSLGALKAKARRSAKNYGPFVAAVQQEGNLV